jgi:hypothetical protein
MRRKEKGLIGLMRKIEDIPEFVTFHCIIHQETLKDCDLQNVMQQVVCVGEHYYCEGTESPAIPRVAGGTPGRIRRLDNSQ